jgi:altronate dehydratase large subunit
LSISCLIISNGVRLLILTGYRRENGAVGFRNHIVVISSVVCANVAVEKLCQQEKEDVIPLTHPLGCAQLGDDYALTFNTLAGLGANPNVGAVLIVGLGCEKLEPAKLAAAISKTGKPVEYLTIQEEGGITRTIEQGSKILAGFYNYLQKQKRVPAEPADIVLGLECGGSDATSGIAANPAVGAASDLLIEAGGTVILSETTELIGAEHILARRAENEAVKKELLAVIARAEERARGAGVDIRGAQPAPGNIEGGLTTIEEKSLGCVHKAGSSTVRGVLDYGEAPQKKGLLVMDTAGFDVESVTGMVAGGSQIIVFTTGRGTPVGNAVAPVIKVTGNPRTAKTMKEHIDVDVSSVILGEETLEEAGQRLYERIIATASGSLTLSEQLGHREIAISRLYPTI